MAVMVSHILLPSGYPVGSLCPVRLVIRIRAVTPPASLVASPLSIAARRSVAAARSLAARSREESSPVQKSGRMRGTKVFPPVRSCDRDVVAFGRRRYRGREPADGSHVTALAGGPRSLRGEGTHQPFAVGPLQRSVRVGREEDPVLLPRVKGIAHVVTDAAECSGGLEGVLHRGVGGGGIVARSPPRGRRGLDQVHAVAVTRARGRPSPGRWNRDGAGRPAGGSSRTGRRRCRSRAAPSGDVLGASGEPPGGRVAADAELAGILAGRRAIFIRDRERRVEDRIARGVSHHRPRPLVLDAARRARDRRRGTSRTRRRPRTPRCPPCPAACRGGRSTIVKAGRSYRGGGSPKRPARPSMSPPVIPAASRICA